MGLPPPELQMIGLPTGLAIAAAGMVPEHAPMMFTTDLSLKVDPSYAKISKGFHENPQAFADAFAKAWFKMTHRDMAPVSRCHTAPPWCFLHARRQKRPPSEGG